MSHLTDVVTGLLMIYEKEEKYRTPERRSKLIAVITEVIDFFTPVKEDDPTR